jgi:hypothetical protein
MRGIGTDPIGHSFIFYFILLYIRQDIPTNWLLCVLGFVFVWVIVAIETFIELIGLVFGQELQRS